MAAKTGSWTKVSAEKTDFFNFGGKKKVFLSDFLATVLGQKKFSLKKLASHKSTSSFAYLKI
jgi:hypothetical protein